MSIVLKPDLEAGEFSPLANITQYMSLIICTLLTSFNVAAEVKWPNDVLVEGRKIAGILSQSSIQDNKLQGYVLGVGINLNLQPAVLKQIDQPATALNLETGMPVDRDQFAEKLLARFFAGYNAFLLNGFSSIKGQYIEKTLFLGKKITVVLFDSECTGTAKGFLDDGCLLLELDTGEVKKISIGDITVT